MVAEFEADLIRARTREGMKVAKAKGRLRGRQPKLTPRQEEHLVRLHKAGEHTTGELAQLFGVARSTVYRAIGRSRMWSPHRAFSRAGQTGHQIPNQTGTAASLPWCPAREEQRNGIRR
jgi:DNA invertase Pin-like site-specific DNA recombinase